MTFIPNRNLARELERSAKVEALKRKAAQEIKGHAQRNVAAIGTPALHPWMGRKGYEVIEVQVEGGEVEVVNTDFGGHLQEWGSVNNAPHAPLRRAVRQAGYRLDEN